jgi:hypothetical protein
VVRSTSVGRLSLSPGLAGQLRRCGAGARVRDKAGGGATTRGESKSRARAVRGMRGSRCGSTDDGRHRFDPEELSRCIVRSERKFIFAAIWAFWIMSE